MSPSHILILRDDSNTMRADKAMENMDVEMVQVPFLNNLYIDYIPVSTLKEHGI